MHGNPPPDEGSIVKPKRASDKVRGTEAGSPWKTGESVAQTPDTFDPNGTGEAVDKAGKPQEAY